MSGPLAMNLLSWRTLPRNPKRKRPQGKIYPYHYGIYVRIQYRIRRRNGTTVHADVANQCPNEETTNDPATFWYIPDKSVNLLVLIPHGVLFARYVSHLECSCSVGG